MQEPAEQVTSADLRLAGYANVIGSGGRIRRLWVPELSSTAFTCSFAPGLEARDALWAWPLRLLYLIMCQLPDWLRRRHAPGLLRWAGG
jgi:hypothetical protein